MIDNMHKLGSNSWRFRLSKLVLCGLLPCLVLLSACGASLNQSQKAKGTNVVPTINSTLQSMGNAQLQTFQQWIALMQQYQGDITTYQQQYHNDQQALQSAHSDATYQEARDAALAGDPEAAALVGDLYAKGGNLPPNYAEAAMWFRRASEAGHKGAARALGMLYLTGAGVPRVAGLSGAARVLAGGGLWHRAATAVCRAASVRRAGGERAADAAEHGDGGVFQRGPRAVCGRAGTVRRADGGVHSRAGLALRARGGFAPLFLVSFSAVAFEIALTRFFAVAAWSEYGYWVISIVMAGFALSGVALALAREPAAGGVAREGTAGTGLGGGRSQAGD